MPTFEQLLEQDLKDDVIRDVLSTEDDNLIDGFISQSDIDKASNLPDEDLEEEI